MNYSDILMMPTAERRFYLGLLVRKKHQEDEAKEEGNTEATSKGNRKTRIGGQTLKNKIRSGEIPLDKKTP